MQNDKKDRLDDLQKNLYSRIERPHILKRSTPLEQEKVDVKEDWPHSEKDGQFNYYPKAASSITKKIMIFSLIFFIVALGVGFYIFFKGSNIFSSNNIEINVLGPVAVSGGEKLGLEINVKNNNNTTLEGAILKVEYPEGTRNADNIAL